MSRTQFEFSTSHNKSAMATTYKFFFHFKFIRTRKCNLCSKHSQLLCPNIGLTITANSFRKYNLVLSRNYDFFCILLSLTCLKIFTAFMRAQLRAEYLKFEFLYVNLKFTCFHETRRSKKLKHEVSAPNCVQGPEWRPKQRPRAQPRAKYCVF